MDKIWLENYPHNVPEDIDEIYYASLISMIDDADKKFYNNIAFTNLTLIYLIAKLQITLINLSLQNDLNLNKGDLIE